MVDTPLSEKSVGGKAAGVVFGAIKYLAWVAIAVGGVLAVFYTSQSAQDAQTGVVFQRVVASETDIASLKRVDERTTAVIELAKQDLSKTREEMAKIATQQEAFSREQRAMSANQQKMDDKLDDLKTILIRMESSRNP